MTESGGEIPEKEKKFRYFRQKWELKERILDGSLTGNVKTTKKAARFCALCRGKRIPFFIYLSTENNDLDRKNREKEKSYVNS